MEITPLLYLISPAKARKTRKERKNHVAQEVQKNHREKNTQYLFYLSKIDYTDTIKKTLQKGKKRAMDLFLDFLEFLSSILELAEAVIERIRKKGSSDIPQKYERSTGQHKERGT